MKAAQVAQPPGEAGQVLLSRPGFPARSPATPGDRSPPPSPPQQNFSEEECLPRRLSLARCYLCYVDLNRVWGLVWFFGFFSNRKNE